MDIRQESMPLSNRLEAIKLKAISQKAKAALLKGAYLWRSRIYQKAKAALLKGAVSVTESYILMLVWLPD